MKHTHIVGKPIKESGGIVDYEDPREIANNEIFRYRKLGYEIIPQAFIDKKRAEEAAEAAGDELKDKKVPELKTIAEALDIDIDGIRKKDDLIQVIRDARAAQEE